MQPTGATPHPIARVTHPVATQAGHSGWTEQAIVRTEEAIATLRETTVAEVDRTHAMANTTAQTNSRNAS